MSSWSAQAPLLSEYSFYSQMGVQQDLEPINPWPCRPALQETGRKRKQLGSSSSAKLSKARPNDLHDLSQIRAGSWEGCHMHVTGRKRSLQARPSHLRASVATLRVTARSKVSALAQPVETSDSHRRSPVDLRPTIHELTRSLLASEPKSEHYVQ